MQSILNKRVFRSLKKHWFRYATLFFLIVMVMNIIVSMVSYSEAIIHSTAKNQEKSKTEDGYFQTFIPLLDVTIADLEEKGITIEKQNYIDFTMGDDSTLRIYKVREQVNLLQFLEGKAPSKNGEIAIEKLYAGSKQMNIGDQISLGSDKFSISGIGTTAEIETPKKNIAAASSDCSIFGLGFVTEETYKTLLEHKEYDSSEVYNYAYLLNGKITDDELEEYLRELKLDVDSVADPYFQEMVKDANRKKTDIVDGVKELTDGAKELTEGLAELVDHNDDLLAGSESIWNADFKEGIVEYINGTKEAKEGSEELSDGVLELKEKTDEIVDEYFDYDIDNLTSFVKAEDNAGISAASDDVKTTLSLAILAGIIVLILITYVISIFVAHSIDRETSVIGALYALGVKRKQLMLHYIMLPILVTFVGGLLGTLIGFSSLAQEQQLSATYSYFSIPKVTYEYPIYLIIYGVVVPPVIAVIVNYIVIRKKLSDPALKMIRNEKKQGKVHNIKIHSKSFIRIFQLRQTLREMQSVAAVVIGLFISMLVLMLGLDCYYGCKNVAVQNKRDVNYENMYLYKYTVDEVPEGGEEAYLESLKKQYGEFNYDVTICGVKVDSEFFDYNLKEGENHITISSSLASKYDLKKGDKLVLTDEINDRDYAFQIDEIVEYSIGLYAFMEIKSMRSLFGKEDTYFNTVLSSENLDIENGRLYAVTTKDSVEKASDIFLELMQSTFVMLIGMSIFVFVIVMYLMIKVMIDRSSQNIALVKVFGYTKKEVRKLYLDGNFVLIAIAALICIPVTKWMIDMIFPSFVANLAMGMDLSFPTYMYVVIYMIILLCYILISNILTKKLERIVPAEALKNRE